MVPVVPKLQQDPHTAWSLTGVTAPENTTFSIIRKNMILLDGALCFSLVWNNMQ